MRVSEDNPDLSQQTTVMLSIDKLGKRISERTLSKAVINDLGNTPVGHSRGCLRDFDLAQVGGLRQQSRKEGFFVLGRCALPEHGEVGCEVCPTIYLH